MADGLELILKLPNPKCWCSHYTTASEVATTEYLTPELNLHAPKPLMAKLALNALSWKRHLWRQTCPCMGYEGSPETCEHGIIQCETTCIKNFAPDFNKDCQRDIYNGPGGYEPMAAKNFKSCKTFQLSGLISYQKSLPSKWIYSIDLYMQNTFVHANNTHQISSIIDCQASEQHLSTQCL